MIVGITPGTPAAAVGPKLAEDGRLTMEDFAQLTEDNPGLMRRVVAEFKLTGPAGFYEAISLRRIKARVQADTLVLELEREPGGWVSKDAAGKFATGVR